MEQDTSNGDGDVGFNPQTPRRPVHPAAEAAQPLLNAFEQPALLDLRDGGDKPLPSCFLPMLDQLSEEQRGKLREIDPSVATVRFRPRGGRDTKPEYLAAFVYDFAEEAASFVGKGGPMLAIVDPNDGKLRPFGIGFIAPEVAPQQGGADRALVERLEAMEAKFQQAMQLMLMGQQPQTTMAERIQELAALAQMFKSMNPAQDPAAYVQAMGGVMGNMTQALIGNLKTMQEAAGALATKPAEKSIAQEVAEIMKIPGASDLTMRLADRVLPAGNGTTPAANPGASGAQQGAQISVNAFDNVTVSA